MIHKPKIKKTSKYWYTCSSHYGRIEGVSYSAEHAYELWAAKYFRRTLVARKGIIAKRGLSSWLDSCKGETSTWIDVSGTLRQLIGFDSFQDYLILRG